MYGRASNSVPYVCQPDTFWSCGATALEKPKSSAAKNAPNGRHLPKMSAASAMKPRPAVMFSVNELTKPSDRNTPPSAASAPEAVTETYRTPYTEIPTVSAARGCSPTDRIRSPSAVLNKTTYDTTRIA